ncbi:SUMF1/EgtB/PvdO family nonheme iron enzyme [Frankia canadensis]|nr:SUMF1/EgtB/PvdO family nonheme iron enzyme [Frankia canadensis]
MTTIIRWTGREIRALREARRMSITAFAHHLGVAERTVSKWEAGRESIIPRPVNQEALDTVLRRSPPEVRDRFVSLIGSVTTSTPSTHDIAPVDEADTSQTRHPVDGKLMIHVGEGEFMSGAAGEKLWIPSYWMDAHPVTNSDYARFIASSGHRPPRHWPAGECPPDLARHPVVWVTWHDAATYADWAGKILPTDRQWEKCARGPYGTRYPWGNSETTAKGNFRESGIGSTTPVDRYHSGVSPYGTYDMCGNTWEWLSTETEPGRRGLKGSAFTSPFRRAEPSRFNDASTGMLDDDTGFRCVSMEIPAPTD